MSQKHNDPFAGLWRCPTTTARRTARVVVPDGGARHAAAQAPDLLQPGAQHETDQGVHVKSGELDPYVGC